MVHRHRVRRLDHSVQPVLVSGGARSRLAGDDGGPPSGPARTAAAEFARAGYEATSLNRSSAAAGSPELLLHYTSSKAQLFAGWLTIWAENWPGGGGPVAESCGGPAFWDQIERLVCGSPRSPNGTGGSPTSDGVLPARRATRRRRWSGPRRGHHRGLAHRRARGGSPERSVRTDLPASLQDALTLAVLRAFDSGTCGSQDPERSTWRIWPGRRSRRCAGARTDPEIASAS